MKKIRLLYLATAPIAMPLLRSLAGDERFEVALVITGPDRPAGRAMKLTPPEIKTAAVSLGLPVFQPENVNAPETAERFRREAPDLAVVFAYGQILSQSLLDIPHSGCVNVHCSLLPKYRGASPIQAALLAGETETGISLMKMEASMDTGPVYDQATLPIDSDDDALTLRDKLADFSAEKTPDVLALIAAGQLPPRPQNHPEATHCKKISKEDGHIHWEEPAEMIARRIRAYAGWPGTYALWKDKRLKILKVQAIDEPGAIGLVRKADGRVLVGTGNGSIALLSVQPEGKAVQSIDEFIKGHAGFCGEHLN